MINLTKAPFFLVKEDIEWVENTKKAMTLEEKIGQLFVPIGYSGDADYLEHVMLSHHIGGIMYRCGEAKEMQRTHRYLQEHSKIPLLVGANLEDGGCGIATDGTQYGKHGSHERGTEEAAGLSFRKSKLQRGGSGGM